MDAISDLTARQRAIYEYIVAYYDERSYPPTIREICTAVGLKSTSNVHAYLKVLERKGYIRTDPTKQRTISVVRPETARGTRVVNIPIIGAVAAGNPILAFDDVRGYWPIPAESIPGANASDVFMLLIEGESMINAGIFDGDMIVVDKGLAVENGDVAVARVSAVYGDSATVKRIYYEKGSVRLQPENDAMKPITVQAGSVEIIGKVIGLYRQF